MSQTLAVTIVSLQDDAYLFRRAFEKSEIPCAIHVVETLPKAVVYLKGDDAYTDRASFPLPNLIITDLALHIEDSIRFIEWLRSEPALSDIQLICLSAALDPLKVNRVRQFAITCIPQGRFVRRPPGTHSVRASNLAWPTPYNDKTCRAQRPYLSPTCHFKNIISTNVYRPPVTLSPPVTP